MSDEESQRPVEKSCEHKTFSKERCLGSHTGDYVCDDCKAVVSPGEKREIEESQGKGMK